MIRVSTDLCKALAFLQDMRRTGASGSGGLSSMMEAEAAASVDSMMDDVDDDDLLVGQQVIGTALYSLGTSGPTHVFHSAHPFGPHMTEPPLHPPRAVSDRKRVFPPMLCINEKCLISSQTGLADAVLSAYALRTVVTPSNVYVDPQSTKVGIGDMQSPTSWGLSLSS